MLTWPVQGIVAAFWATTFDSAKQSAYHLTEQYLRLSTTTQQMEQSRTVGTKRKYHEESTGNVKHLKPKSEPMNVYNTKTNTPIPSKSYSGTLPHCTKCNFHHVGNCMVCNNCNLRGHTSMFCRMTPNTTNSTTAIGKMHDYFKCNQPGHFKKDGSQLKN